MPYQHGRGKESFRIFKRSLNEQIKAINQAAQEGEYYTYEETQGFFGEILAVYEEQLISLQLDVELWYVRASNYALERFNTFSEKYDFADSGQSDSEPDSDSGSDRGDDEWEDFPLNIIESDECEREDGRERGVILTSIEEAIDYIQPIPDNVVVGFIPIFDENGDMVGLKPCVRDSSS